MKAEKILANYKKHTEVWLSELEKFTPDTFAKSFSSDWSAAQVVDHICKTTHKCLSNAELCIERNGETGHSGFGPAVFGLMGAFPPVKIRIKVPPKGLEEVYQPKHISLDEARLQLGKAQERMELIFSNIASADPGIRIEHWAGGWFNGLQWFHNAEMHIKHHFRQLRRIKKNSVLTR